MPTPIITLPIHTIEQARALAGLLRAYIDGQQPDTNDGQDWKPDPDLAGVAALYAHLDAGIAEAGKPHLTGEEVTGDLLMTDPKHPALLAAERWFATEQTRDLVTETECEACAESNYLVALEKLRGLARIAFVTGYEAGKPHLTGEEKREIYRKHIDAERERWAGARRIMGIPDPA